jgi:hypothetical protein
MSIWGAPVSEKIPTHSQGMNLGIQEPLAEFSREAQACALTAWKAYK